MKIERIDQKPGGRVFVCGDIHGSYSCVERFLKEINFDESVDLFISVGDLVDRGPSNELVLDLLYKDWFKAVAGNHEDLMLDYFNRIGLQDWWAPNGGRWGLRYRSDIDDFSREVHHTITQKVSKLPDLITVKL